MFYQVFHHFLPPPQSCERDSLFHVSQLRMSQSSSKAADTTLDACPHLSATSTPGGFSADVMILSFGNWRIGTPSKRLGIAPRW